MKKNGSNEGLMLAAVIVAVLLTGTLTGHWFLMATLILTSYILWIYSRLLKLEKWLSRGTKISEVYDDHGLIGTIIRHLYRQKKINSDRKKRAKEILGRLNRNISALPDATVLLNQYREIEWCNEPAQYLLSIHARNDLGQRITNLIRNPEFLRYLNTPGDRQYLEMISPYDSSITLQLKRVSFGNNQSLLIARNVSEQKQLQEGLKNFVANASHELKSPLTVLSGHLEMLGSEKGLTKQGLNSLQIAQHQSQRMKILIEDLLLLSRIESYHLQPDEGEDVDVSELITAAIKLLDSEGRVQFRATNPFHLLGVRSELEGVCINLIENALKYSNPATEVMVSWTENELKEGVLTVVDRGNGISAQDLPHITDRYFRSNLAIAERLPGSGLGLSIVEQVANKHGATLNIKSQLGQGSEFKVVFPSYRRSGKQEQTASIIQLTGY